MKGVSKALGECLLLLGSSSIQDMVIAQPLLGAIQKASEGFLRAKCRFLLCVQKNVHCSFFLPEEVYALNITPLQRLFLPRLAKPKPASLFSSMQQPYMSNMPRFWDVATSPSESPAYIIYVFIISSVPCHPSWVRPWSHTEYGSFL